MADGMIGMAERVAAARVLAEEEAAEFVKMLETMREELEDAEKRRLKEQSVNDWLSWLEQTAYNMDNLLDQWDRCLHHHDSNLSEEKITEKIVDVKGEIEKIVGKKDVYGIGIREHTTSCEPTPSLLDSEQVHGRDSDTEFLLSKLTSNTNHGDLQLLSVVGMAGIGKTTLAQLVYNHDQIKQHFKYRIWIHVSHHSDEAQIANEIIEAIKKSPSNPMEMLVTNLADFIAGNNNNNHTDNQFTNLANSVKGKKFLLVLDDVWTPDYSKWESLKKALNHGGAGSRMLITTRNDAVAEKLGATDKDILRLEPLSWDDSWNVMKHAALSGRSDADDGRYHDIGKRVVGNCQGLPLAAVALGKHLHSKNSFYEWENVSVNEAWEAYIFPRLISSYNDFRTELKRCFSFCGLFPKDSRIQVADVIEMWTVVGYLGSNMELKGQEFVHVLAKNSLFEEFGKDDHSNQITWFKLHDIVHDFARYIRTNTVEKNEEKKCEVCHPLLVSSAKEYRSILLEHTSFLNLCPCLATARLLRTNYMHQSIPQGIEKNLIHLRWLDLSNSNLFEEELRTICKLYHLQTLLLCSCRIEQIPSEIANLIHLRHLNLMGNPDLKELSEGICSLLQLQILNVDYCYELESLPQGIKRLVNLKHFYFKDTKLQALPEELGQLVCLNTVTEFRVGGDWSKWGMLKNLDQLSGSLKLYIKPGNDEVEEVREAEMEKKVYIQEEKVIFEDEMDDEEMSMAKRSDIIEALTLPPNLQSLMIWSYKGSKFPLPASKLDQLKNLYFNNFMNLKELPPLGLLPNLEDVFITAMEGLQIVGKGFLGIDSSSGSRTSVVSFPKLKELTFHTCGEWREWEDITAEEEESAAVQILPCLTKLQIIDCAALEKVPYRLLHKAASMEEFLIYGTKVSSYSVRQSLSQNKVMIMD